MSSTSGDHSVKRLHVGARLSETAIHQGVVYLAGQIAEDRSQDMFGQTREVLGHIDRLLAEAGSDKSLILSALVLVSDMSQFNEMNRAWDAWVVEGHAPPRASFEARLAFPELLVEMKIVAAQRV
jgi:enamine deaminase RidA (YjgF/YER057c/UK114 family)